MYDKIGQFYHASDKIGQFYHASVIGLRDILFYRMHHSMDLMKLAETFLSFDCHLLACIVRRHYCVSSSSDYPHLVGSRDRNTFCAYSRVKFSFLMPVS